MLDHEPAFNPTPRLLVVIIDRDEIPRLEDVLREKHVHFHYMLNAMGTASSEILKAFGLSGTEKTICLCMVPEYRAAPLMNAVKERLELVRPGHGVVFVIPVSGVSALISHAFSKDIEEHKERLAEYMDREAEKTCAEARYELILAMVNQGFSDGVMDAARASGARGGTIVNARHSGLGDAVKFFGISLQEEKEVVAILTTRELKKDLMLAICKASGMKTPARGIVVSLPVESCAGIDMGEADEAE